MGGGVAITGSVVNWAVMWEIWSGAAIIFGVGILTTWAVVSVFKLSRRSRND